MFDFELFQSVHGHTTHNEHALFTGRLLPSLDPAEDPPSVKADALFGHFKRAGYQTMWQEDLCWTAGWGLVPDLVAEDWKESANRREKMYPILRACQRLRPLRFENVRERNSKSDGALITNFDVYFQSGSVVKHEEDIFHVEVKSKDILNQNSLEMELVHFDRLTLFGKYEVCADEGVQLKLCICSERKDHEILTTQLQKAPWVDYTTVLFKNAKARKIGDSECLYVIKRNHSSGQSIAFEVANTCPDENFTLKIWAEFENLRLSKKLPFEMSVQARNIKFAFSARTETVYWDTRIDVTVDVKSKTSQI